MTKPFSQSDTTGIIEYLVDRIYTDFGFVIKKAFDVKNLELWENMRKSLHFEQTASQLKTHFSESMIPQFSAWPFDFETKCDLWYGLGLPIETLIALCESREKIRIDLNEGAAVKEKYLIIWKFLFAVLRDSATGEDGKLKWKKWTEGETGLPSYNKSARYLEKMPFFIDDKLFLLQILKIPVSEAFIERVKKTKHLLTHPDGYILECSLHKFQGSDKHEKNDNLSYDKSLEEEMPPVFKPYKCEDNAVSFEMRNLVIKKEPGESKNEESKTVKLPTLTTKNARLRRTFTPEEDKQIWKFINKKIRDLRTGEPRRGLFEPNNRTWKEFKNRIKSDRSEASINHRFRTFLDICEAPFSKRTKLELYYALEFPVDKIFKQRVEERYKLKLDFNGRIEECESEKWAQYAKTDDEMSDDDIEDNECDSEDEGDFEPSFTWSESFEMWNFILKQVREERAKIGKTQKMKEKPSEVIFWEKFKKNVGPPRHLETLAIHYELNLSRKVNCAPFDIETKANLYYALHIPVTFDFLIEFQKVASPRFEEDTGEIPYLFDYSFKDNSVVREQWSDLWLAEPEKVAQMVRNDEM